MNNEHSGYLYYRDELYRDELSGFGHGLITASQFREVFERLQEPVPPPSEEEMAYVYESLGVKPPPPKICKHLDRRPITNMLERCTDCQKVIATSVSNRRWKR